MLDKLNMLGREDNFLGIEAEFSSFAAASFVILQAPLERTTSYGKGASEGPGRIIGASQQVELYDEELGEEPYRRGIATAGEMRFGSMSGREAVRKIAENVTSVLDAQKFPVVLGGEHTVTAGAVEGLAAANRSQPFSVLQLDAHSDLRDSYEGDPYSHASVMRRVWEIEPSIVLCGIRSQCAEEAAFIEGNGIPVFYAHRLAESASWEPVLDSLRDNVYLTIDCDFFDPSIMPAVGTPEPGGFLWRETLQFLGELSKRKNLIGFDVSELAPQPALVHADFTAARLVYKLIGFIGSSQPDRFPLIG